MHVRLKLDTCGIKLKLAQWTILVPQNVKPWLRSLAPLRAKLKAYREFLQQLVQQHRGTADEIPVESHPAWMDATTIPTNLQEKAQEMERHSPTVDGIDSCVQRFALIKLQPPVMKTKTYSTAGIPPALNYSICNPND